MRFILLDRIVELDIGDRVIATKTFCPQEEFFLDHFPGFPVVPGTLLTEVMAQAGGWLVASTVNFRLWPFLSMIDKVKFRQFVRPGEALHIEASIRSSEERQYWVSAKICRSDQWVARARLFYHLMDQPEVVFNKASVDQLASWRVDVFEGLGGGSFLKAESEKG